MHYAVDHVDMNTIFPRGVTSSVMQNPSAFKKCMTDLKSSDLNQLQKDAVLNMLKPSFTEVSHTYMYCIH